MSNNQVFTEKSIWHRFVWDLNEWKLWTRIYKYIHSCRPYISMPGPYPGTKSGLQNVPKLIRVTSRVHIVFYPLQLCEDNEHQH